MFASTFRSARASLVVITFTSLFLFGCDSNEPDPSAGEEEVITHVVITLENEVTLAVTTATAEFSEAGVLINAETLVLTAGETYGASMTFRNDIESEDITAEILDEAEFHQLIYQLGGSIVGRATVTDRDQDSNGNPLGLTFTLTDTGTTGSSGTLNVRLRHYEEDAVLPDDKISDNGETEIPGVVENDINVTFPVTVFP